MERNQGTKVPWNFRSRGRKFLIPIWGGYPLSSRGRVWAPEKFFGFVLTFGVQTVGRKPVGRKTFGRIIFWATDDWAKTVISEKTFRRKTVGRQRPK